MSVKIEAKIKWQAEGYPQFLTITVDKSEFEDMTEEEKKEHIDEIIKEQILNHVVIEWTEEKELVTQ